MATKKRSSSHKKNNSKKAAEAAASFRGEVTVWITLAVSVLLFLSNFGIIGTVGNALSKVLFGFFGIIAFIFPILLFLAITFGLVNRGERAAVVKLLSAGVFVLFICGLIQLLTNRTQDFSPISAFLDGFTMRHGGGFFGGIVTGIFCPTIGKVGAYVVTFAALIISAVLFTGRSAIGGIKKSSKKVYDRASENAAIRRENMRSAKEMRRQMRLENKASGVSMDTSLKKPGRSPLTDEISALMEEEPEEITPKKKAKVYPIGKKMEKEEEPSGLSDGMKQLVIHTAASGEHIAPIAAAEPIEPVAPITPVAPPASMELTNLIEPAHSMGSSNLMEPAHSMKSKDSMEPFFAAEEEKSDDTEGLTDFSEEVGNMMREAELKELTAPVHAASERKAAAPSSSIETAPASSIEAASASTLPAAPKHKSETYQFPPVSLLSKGNVSNRGDSEAHLRETAEKLQQVLETFGVRAKVTDVSCGPSVTRYELQPEMGVKVSRIVSLADDIKLNLAAADIRIEAPIPGKAAVGIEVPNKESVPVMFRDLVDSPEFKNVKSNIAFGAGKDIGGKVVIADIAKMPHVLIAGATGSGKSVCINTIIMSILYRANPEDVKLIMIDPKVVELSVYNGIPHLLIPVVTEPKKAAGALNWAVQEMTDRYQKFAQYQVRKIEEYNQKIETIKDIPDENKPQKMPQIVVIVDELADLMMVAPGEVEDSICRLAQLARACGIHLVIATQRPSVNVITGLIKANMPSRIAFAVTSGVDSRTILDMVGAEKLLGKGDMLFYPQGLPKPLRVQGAFVSDKEVSDVVAYIKENNGEMAYDSEMEEKVSSASSGSGGFGSGSDSGGDDGRDEYFLDSARLIVDKEKASIGMLQRHFKIGFNRAARIMDQLEEAGVVGPEAGTKPREILMSTEQLENYLETNG